MRKIYIALLSFFSLCLLSPALNAQVNTYVFAPSAGTFTPLTGTTTSTATGDDGVQNVAIGFNFVFGGVTYTNAILSTNGALKLAADGTTGFATSWTNNLSNAYGAAIIAPFWDDNNASGGSIVYTTSGTAPNRVFSAEWRNIHLGGGGSSTAPTGTFQVNLAEGTNFITIVYGTMNAPTAATASIGVNDLVSFLSVTPGAPATYSSATANNNITSVAAIPSGTTYTIFPPPPCVPGSLNGGTAAAAGGPICPGSPFSVSVTGASFGAGLTFQWESSLDGTTGWTNVAGATGQTLTTSTSGTTYYRRKMTCSGTDAYSTVVSVSTAPPVSVFPWTENFDGLATVGATSFPSCWVKQNGDWRSANNGTSGFDANARSAPNFIQNAWSASNEFIWTNGFQLTAGQSYDFSFWFANFDGYDTWVGDVFVNGTPNSAGATQVGASFATNGTASSNTYTEVLRSFTPSASGVYYFGIRVNEATGNPWYLSFDDFRLDLTPPCAAPTLLTVPAVTTTTANLSWTASVTPPANGYQWEVRTSGAPGSGATGLAASGTTAAGATTATATGLTANTAYTYYVRSACSGVLNSAWSTGFSFQTACDAVTVFPFTETFEASSTTRPCWTNSFVSGSQTWTYGAGAGNGGAITSAHGGTLNAQFFGDGDGGVTRLVSPSLNLSGMPAIGAQLTFWYANQNWLGDQNELRVFYKTSAAGPWTLVPGAVYTTNVGAWTEVELLLPGSTSGDYYIAFEGTEEFGYGVAVDDVTIAPAPTCPKPTLVSAVGTSPTTASVFFTSPGGAFVVEYGAPGFVPGTTNAAGGGTVVFGASSPIQVTGLSASTTYDFYVRRICVPGADYSQNVKTTATTLCAAVAVPYLQDFSSATPPEGFPTCTSMQDVNGNSGPVGNTSGGRWTTFNGTSNQVYVSPTQSMRYLYDAQNLSRPADDWFYIQALNLTGGQSYRLKFYYKASDGPVYVEGLEVKYGTMAEASAMTNTLFTNTTIATALANPWDSAIVDFTPAANGAYYIGFHAISAGDQAFLYIDDISVKVTPLVDAGISAVANVPTCPATNNVIRASVTNYNTTPLNFATYPVVVTANITGSATTTLTTTINTGTLAPGATQVVDLPAFTFAAGTYTITVSTSNADDPEAGNNTQVVNTIVNPSPVAAILTPAAPAVCPNGIAQISTQFVTPPPAPVTLPAVSSGTITLAIPDASLVGANHTLNVSGIPAGATLTGISVNINATHTWNADMIFNLRAPNGNILNLVNRKGGSGDNFVNAVISSTGTGTVPTAATSPVTGTFAADGANGVGPTGFVSNVTAFTGLYSVGNGAWTLAVNDNAGGDIGTIDSWSITLTYGFPHPRVTWAPITGLFTDAAATVPYTANSNAYMVYAKPAGTTTYTVTSTSPANCTSTSSVTVTVNPTPVINIAALPTRICISDSSVALNATPAGGTWSGIGVSGNLLVPPMTAVGTYPLTYSYVNEFGCPGSSTVTAQVVDCPERIILLRDNAVILWPNPNTGQFNIRINSVLYNNLTMKVYTASGALARTQQYNNLAFGRVIPVDLTSLPSGTYMVQFSYVGGPRTSDKTFKVVVGR